MQHWIFLSIAIISEVIARLGNRYRHVIPVAPTVDCSEIEKYQMGIEVKLVSDTSSALQGAAAALYVHPPPG